MRDPFGGGSHGCRFDPTAVNSAVFLAGQESGVLEHAQVLGYGGKRHREGVGELGHRGLPEGQSRQDRPTGRVRESGKRGVEGLGIINHLVKYYRSADPVSRGAKMHRLLGFGP